MVILCGLLIGAAGPAWAQSATGSTSGVGNYGLSNSDSGFGFGGGAGSTKGKSTFGASRGINDSSAATGAFSSGNAGLATGASGLPSLGAPPPASAHGDGPPGPPGRPIPGSTGVTP
jgi:hypothetical protein